VESFAGAAREQIRSIDVWKAIAAVVTDDVLVSTVFVLEYCVAIHNYCVLLVLLFLGTKQRNSSLKSPNLLVFRGTTDNKVDFVGYFESAWIDGFCVFVVCVLIVVTNTHC
jgi:hypothetical protein